jgi:pimeloyl-ACP methyl ester carboxylesterase
MEAQLKQREARGLTSAWLEAGPAEPAAGTPVVVLMHGFPDSAKSWSFQIDALKDRFTVVAPYVRGTEPSEKAQRIERYAPDAVGLDVLEILREVDPTGKRPVVVVGHDLGAVHAWHVAELLQDRAKGVVLINGLTVRQMARRLTNPAQLKRSWYIFLLQVPLLPELLAKTASAPLLRFAHNLGGLPADLTPEVDDPKDVMIGPLNQYRAFMRLVPRALLRPVKRLACPVLALWGKDDAFVVAPKRSELERDAEKVTVRILPGNHWLHRQDSERVNKLLIEFVEQSGVPA